MICFISRVQDCDVQRSRKNIEFLAMQGERFSVHHYIHGRIQIKFDAFD